MKCFYHEEKDAVATCQVCGKSLCKACAEKYTPCMCYECAKQKMIDDENQKKENKKLDLVDTKQEFIAAVVKGLLLDVVYVVLMYIISGDLDLDPSILLLLFFVPYGWPVAALMSWTDSMFLNLFILAIKLAVSFIVGVPVMIFTVIKFVMRLINNKNM